MNTPWINRAFGAALAILCLAQVVNPPQAQAAPFTQFGENFDSGDAPGFKKGGSSTTYTTWTVNAGQYRNVITAPSGIGGTTSYSVRGMPYMGGVHRKDFTMSSKIRVVSASHGFTVGMVALAPTHPYNTTNGPYYWFCMDSSGAIKIRTKWDDVTGLTLGTPTNLPGAMAIGTTYTFIVQGTYNGNSLNLDFTVTDGTNTASLSATAATALTGPSFGFLTRSGSAGSSLTVDVDDWVVDVPMTFTQVWADEFNGTTLDTSVWSKGYRWANTINNELQAMRPENVVVGNGVCTINVTRNAGAINHAGGYAAGTTALAVDGFSEAIPNGAVVRIGGATYGVASTVGGSNPTQITLTAGLSVAVADNAEVIHTAKNRDMTNYEWGAFDYRSGTIQTYNKWTKTYGYFEARIKMPSGKGTWPAFWLMPDRGPGVTPLDRRVGVEDQGYGRGSEIDITEYMAAWTDPVTQLSRSHSGLIWSYGGTGNATSDYALTADGFGTDLWYPNAETGFHTYGVYWEPGVVTFYLDGKVVLTRERPLYVPNVPEYMILNTSITQNDWNGNTIPISTINAGTPCKMEIDYVRVYDVTPGVPPILLPEADSYVWDAAPTTNYGTAVNLTVKDTSYAGYDRIAYLRFPVSELGGTVGSATLNLTVAGIGGEGPGARNIEIRQLADDSWSETGVTWNNKPASSGALIATIDASVAGVTHSIDVTSYVNAEIGGNGQASFVLIQSLNIGKAVTFGSRENAGNEPYIEVQ
jgi:beta-glucanase (GH16 family)